MLQFFFFLENYLRPNKCLFYWFRFSISSQFRNHTFQFVFDILCCKCKIFLFLWFQKCRFRCYRIYDIRNKYLWFVCCLNCWNYSVIVEVPFNVFFFAPITLYSKKNGKLHRNSFASSQGDVSMAAFYYEMMLMWRILVDKAFTLCQVFGK